MTSLKSLAKSRKTQEVVPPPPPPAEKSVAKVEKAPVVVEEIVEQPPAPPKAGKASPSKTKKSPPKTKKSPKKSPPKSRRRREIVEEEEELPADLPEEEEEEEAGKELAKYEGIPAMPSTEEVANNLDAWRAYSEELQRIIGEIEGSGAASDVGSDASEFDVSETEEGEEEEEEGEEEEKEHYVSETLEERKARATTPLEWQCYSMNLEKGPRKLDDVLCCRGDHCTYANNPELLKIETAKRAKRGAGAEEKPYEESFRLLGTDVHICDRCYLEAKQNIIAEQEKAKKAKDDEDTEEMKTVKARLEELKAIKKKSDEEKAEDAELKKKLKELAKEQKESEKGHSVKSKGKKEEETEEIKSLKAKLEELKISKTKTEEEKEEEAELKKELRELVKEQKELKETPLVIPGEVHGAIEEEYTAYGLPREPKITTKPRSKRAEEDEDSAESDDVRASEVSDDDEDFE